MLAEQLWRLSEAGDPASFLGTPVEAADAALHQRLLQRGVLRHRETVSYWDVCGGCDCGGFDRPIRWLNGVPTAICPVDSDRDEVLSADDLVSYQVSIADLVAVSAKASGLAEVPEEVEAGVWRLGQAQGRHVVFVVPTSLALDRPGLLGTLHRIAPDQDILLLGPAVTERRRADLTAQRVHHATPSARLVAAPASEPLALDLTLVVPASRVIRLRLFTSRSTIELDGQTLELPSRSFALLKLLSTRALSGKPIVSVAEIESALFSSATSASRPRGLVRELRACLGCHFKTSDNLVVNRAGIGYSIALEAREIQVDP